MRILVGFMLFIIAAVGDVGPAAAKPERWDCPKTIACGRVSAKACKAQDVLWGTETADRPWSIDCRGTSIRFELRSGDVWSRDQLHNHPAERVELAELVKHDPAKDVWISFAMKVEPGTPTSGKWTELGQFHNTPDPNEMKPSPAVVQGFERNDVFRIYVRSAAENPLVVNPKPQLLYRDVAFARGRTYNFVYRIHYNLGPEGSLDCWIDGRSAVSYRGPVGFVDERGPYFKFGIYREPAAETITVDYANVEVGGAELAARITKPLSVRF